MATIWFGDVTPQTALWKVFVMIYAFIWVPLFVSLSWLILETRFNKHLKKYITKFYKELHAAEMELKEVEDRVWEELWAVTREAQRTQVKVERTQKDVKSTKKKVEKIEKVIEESIERKNKPRRKIRKKKQSQK